MNFFNLRGGGNYFICRGIKMEYLLAHLMGDEGGYSQNGFQKPYPTFTGNVLKAQIKIFGQADSSGNIQCGNLWFTQNLNNLDNTICIFIPEATRYFYQVLSSNPSQKQGMATKLLDGMVAEHIYGSPDPFQVDNSEYFRRTYSEQFFLVLVPGTRILLKWASTFETIGMIVYDSPDQNPSFDTFWEHYLASL